MTGEYISTAAIGNALGLTRQAVMERAKKERWACVGQGRDLRWLVRQLPEYAQLAMTARSGKPEPAQDEGVFASAREEDREKAKLRAAFFMFYEQNGMNMADFVTAYNDGVVNKVLLRKLGPVSAPNMYKLYKKWREAGRNFSALTPRWTAGRAVLGPGASIPEQVKGYAEFLYLKPSRPSAGHVYTHLSMMAEQGLIPELPSYQTVLRYLKSLPPTKASYWRDGPDKWKAKFQPYIQQDRSLYLPMDKVTSDHVMMDRFVEKDGRIFRPWLTTVQDFRSGMVLGMMPSVSPNWLSITVSLFQMAMQYGRAKTFVVDNGKDYRCRYLNGVTRTWKTVDADGFEQKEQVHNLGAYAACVDQVSFTWTYAGQSKGEHERHHGTWHEYFCKEANGYVGSNTTDCPEETKGLWRGLNALEKRMKIQKWDDFVMDCAAFLDYWNSSWRGDGQGMNGRTPREVWATFAPPPRPVDPDVLELALSLSDKRRVMRNGVKIDGVFYYSDELLRFTGTDVLVRRPLANPEAALICDAKGALLCRAEANYFAETGDLRATIERRKKAAKTNIALVRGLSTGLVEPPSGSRSIVEMHRAKIAGQLTERTAFALAAGSESDVQPPDANAASAAERERRKRTDAFFDRLIEE